MKRLYKPIEPRKPLEFLPGGRKTIVTENSSYDYSGDIPDGAKHIYIETEKEYLYDNDVSVILNITYYGKDEPIKPNPDYQKELIKYNQDYKKYKEDLKAYKKQAAEENKKRQLLIKENELKQLAILKKKYET